MDPLPRPSDTELVRLLEEEREAVERPDGPTTAPATAPGRRHFEGALPLEDFLREIDEHG